MVQVQSRLEIQQEYIIQLLNQLTDEYQTLKPEMKQIAQQYPGADDEFAFLEEFELLIVNICGYAKQIQAIGSVKQFDVAIHHLQQLQVFANTTMAQFYVEARWKYPKVHSYLQMLNYLRLLMLEYLQIQETIQPISA
jgi:hypothetical protein